MKKLLILGISILLFFTLSSSKKAYAQDFQVTADIEYIFQENGETNVTHEVGITNVREFIHAPDYTITLNVAGIEEMQVVGNDGTSIPFTVNDTQHDGKKITIVFPDRVVGEGNTQEFLLKYKTSTLATKMGNTWEVNIPSITGKDTTTSVSVVVPESFGEASVIKSANKVETVENVYIFSQNSLEKAGALLIFGDEEFYRLSLTYRLENANFFPLRTEIALPPQTQYQEVIFEEIDPKPQSIIVDEDENYLAQYSLQPHESKEVVAQIIVKVSSHSGEMAALSDDEFRDYTSRDQYWEQGGKITELADIHTTPQQIYNHIVKTYSYNHDRIAEQSTRQGAQRTVENPEDLVCLEFTDLYVALARSAGIPARSVEGYAYTENQETRPRSLVRDILHAWPEYYDKDTKKWIAVDPTWANTTGGVDYFTSLDLAHITFVKKGNDSTYPIPAGGYSHTSSQKQVKVDFADPSDFRKNEEIVLTARAQKISNPFAPAMIEVNIKNVGNAVIHNKKMYIRIRGTTKEFKLKNLPPYATFTTFVDTGTSPLTKKTHQITMQLGTHTVSQEITTGIHKEVLILYIGGTILGALIFGFSIKAGSIYLSRRKK